jgi:26S proteasome regulatory subunit N7
MGEVIEKIPNLELRKYQFLIQSKIDTNPTNLLNAIKQDGPSSNTDMGPYYSVVAPLIGGLDQTLLDQINSKNAQALALLDQKLQDATDNLGETEISECLLAKANHYSRIGDLPNAVSAFNLAIEKTSPLGHRIDLHFSLIRIALLFDNVELVSSTIDKVKLYSSLIQSH